MSAAAIARLRAVVDRVAAAVGIDHASVVVAVDQPARACDVWWASVVWPLDDLNTFEGGKTPDAAVDAIVAELARRAGRRVEREERAIADAREQMALWQSVRDACDGGDRG